MSWCLLPIPGKTLKTLGQINVVSGKSIHIELVRYKLSSCDIELGQKISLLNETNWHEIEMR
jgi:hypothetical protein